MRIYRFWLPKQNRTFLKSFHWSPLSKVICSLNTQLIMTDNCRRPNAAAVMGQRITAEPHQIASNWACPPSADGVPVQTVNKQSFWPTRSLESCTKSLWVSNLFYYHYCQSMLMLMCGVSQWTKKRLLNCYWLLKKRRRRKRPLIAFSLPFPLCLIK